MLLIAVIFLAHPHKTWLWAICLFWKSYACLMNARRCGRRHCLYTGPFYGLMAVAGLLHGYQILWLGPWGWWWLFGVLIAIGWGLLWLVLERLWGKYRTAR